MSTFPFPATILIALRIFTYLISNSHKAVK